MAWAMPSDPATTGAASAPPQTGGPLSREFNAMQAAAPAASAHSMADTLQSAFGLGAENGATPEFVRNAYGRLRALGM